MFFCQFLSEIMSFCSFFECSYIFFFCCEIKGVGKRCTYNSISVAPRFTDFKLKKARTQ